MSFGVVSSSTDKESPPDLGAQWAPDYPWTQTREEIVHGVTIVSVFCKGGGGGGSTGRQPP